MAECNHCGSFVTDAYARVFGDNENRVDDCRNCPTVRGSRDEPDGGRTVLLRDLREPTSRERDAPAREPVGETAADDTDETDAGRFRSRLAAVVSALRS